MALTANREVDRYVDQELRSFSVAAAVHIYKGAFVGLNTSGYARPLTAGDKFLGMAYEEIDNSSGANGDKSVRVYSQGDFGHALAGAAVTDIGDQVFASADDTLTLTPTGNSFVGLVKDVPVAGEIILRIDTEQGPAAHIVDPSGGATVDAEARTAINAILVVLEDNGLTKSA